MWRNTSAMASWSTLAGRPPEDAAVRAVHASLALLAALEPLNATHLEPRYGVRVQVRLGLHTGMAVIGTMGGGDRHEQLAMGDTPNIAARLQGLAAPDTVVLSAITARLVQRRFALETLGTHPLKGVTEPMPVFRCSGSPTPLTMRRQPHPAQPSSWWGGTRNWDCCDGAGSRVKRVSDRWC